jgi:porin-like protein
MRGMDHRMARWTVFPARVVAVAIASAVVFNSGAIAQTLVEPNSKPKLSQPSGLTKSQPALRRKSCSAFGAGFAQVPGTDTCVKIGGFVTIEGTVNGR